MYSLEVNSKKKIETPTINPYENRQKEQKCKNIEPEIDKPTEEIILIEEPPKEKDLTIEFTSGNPEVELIMGELHLFKNKHQFDNLPERVDELPQERSTILCILAVPSIVSTVDFLKFVSSYKRSFSKIRIIRDSSPNKYMAILKFRNQEDADSFYQEYNGRPFNSFDPEECRLVFVSHVKFDTPKGVEIMGTPSPIYQRIFEVPTCPVCLEHLDSETSGIVTTICNHTFHCDCLSKWGEPSCPCCRYDPEKSESSCSGCNEKKNLWICLICGHIGCSRYSNRHAEEHFDKTKHNYAMELETQRVWDYFGDGYVHRLIAHKGEIVELSSTKGRSQGVDEERLEVEFSTKVDYVCKEYNQLLTSQLESQRGYFEKIIREMKRDFEEKIEILGKEAEEAKIECKKANKKLEQVSGKSKKHNDDYEGLKELNERLMKNITDLKEKWEIKEKQMIRDKLERDKTILDLESQVKDLMFYLDTQQKVEESPHKESIQGGTVIVTQTEVQDKKKKKKK